MGAPETPRSSRQYERFYFKLKKISFQLHREGLGAWASRTADEQSSIPANMQFQKLLPRRSRPNKRSRQNTLRNKLNLASFKISMEGNLFKYLKFIYAFKMYLYIQMFSCISIFFRYSKFIYIFKIYLHIQNVFMYFKYIYMFQIYIYGYVFQIHLFISNLIIYLKFILHI